MARPKGCKCGTPQPCLVHPDKAAAPAPETEATDATEQTAEQPAPGLFGIDGGKAEAKPRRRDPKPKARKPRKPVAPTAPDDAALVAMLSELLTMPAIPAALVFHCEFCRDHFIAEGPKAARELVALSIVNPALRGALESLHSGWSKITIMGVLAGYLAKPMLHHLAPEPVLNAAGPVVGVPPRPPKPKAHHGEDHPPEYESHQAAPAEYESHAAEDQYASDPAAGLDAA